MTIYTVALFAHLLGVLSLFIGMGLQWAMALRLRQAQTVTQVREWSSLARGVGALSPVSGVLILGAGLYMTVTTWGMRPWIVVSLAAMAFMMVLGIGLIARSLRAIQRAVAPIEASVEAIPQALQRQIHDPVLWISTQLAGSMGLGVVFLMTIKPGLGSALLVLAVALVLGGIVGGMGTSLSRRRPAAALPAQQARLS